jgi:acyl-coenzyme A synthetase/AMP-(fatty) acid ligase
MQHSPLPLFNHALDQAIALRSGQAISANAFLQHALSLASELPERQYGINLCEDRYHFLVSFAAILLKGQTNLLPPSHTAKTIQTIAQGYNNCYCLLDHEFSELNLPRHRFSIPAATTANQTAQDVPQIPYQHIACIPFTSGSTGTPNPNPKTWGRLLTVTQLIQNAFGISNDRPLTIVATVPPQHMYGLETSILLPLVSGSCVYSGRPFYPEDVRQALASINGAKILITTPIHLRACVHAGLQFPAVDFIISATAPLPVELAQQAESVFNCNVLEIYGCTEFGSLAKRRTTTGETWRLFDGLWLSEDADSGDFFVNGEFLDQPVALSDQIEILPDHQFRLLGRKSDMINIAGKRASMADLNLKLLAIPGIKDGVIFYPEEKADTVTRVVAFVVAPELSAQQILQELKQHFDSAFLPRPIYQVSELPREKSGKLPRKNLLALWKQMSQ